MFKRRLGVLVLAAVMGFIASYLVYHVVKTARGQQAGVEQIVVAQANIDIGEALTPRHVKIAEWPQAAIPPGSIKSVKDAEGRVAKASIVAGEPVLDSKLAPVGQGGLMPVLVPPGKRAVSIKVDEAAQRSGFIVPNSRVDVLVTIARQDRSNEKATRIVLQDVQVLAADQTVEMKDNRPVTMTTVTMAISPQESERLALAQNEGKVTLALRSLQDNAVVSTPGVTVAQLMGSPAPTPTTAGTTKVVKHSSSATHKAVRSLAKPAVATTTTASQSAEVPTPPVRTHTVSVIRGSSSTDLVFEEDPTQGWREASNKADAKKPR